MDLDQLANFGEFIGGVAVLITLIYLAVQVRNGTRAVASSNQDMLLVGLRSTRHAVAMDNTLAELVLRGERDPGQLADTKMKRFEQFATSQLESERNVFATANAERA